ncbi:MAG: NADH-quinone oxidoreductase subunit NuoE [Chloroflexi bacterium]|nr:NADH-quinone oxidoreductase subunit NuoE [Chloroflexota bacterium]
MMLSERAREEIIKTAERFPERRTGLLPALRLAQDEQGYLSSQVLVEVAAIFELTPAEVEAVASFYTMLKRRPTGKHLIQVCTNLPCALSGAGELLDHLKARLGIGVGETTPDGLFTLETVECLGSCGTAPVVQIDEDYHENLSAEAIEAVLARLAGG